MAHWAWGCKIQECEARGYKGTRVQGWKVAKVWGCKRKRTKGWKSETCALALLRPGHTEIEMLPLWRPNCRFPPAYPKFGVKSQNQPLRWLRTSHQYTTQKQGKGNILPFSRYLNIIARSYTLWNILLSRPLCFAIEGYLCWHRLIWALISYVKKLYLSFCFVIRTYE